MPLVKPVSLEERLRALAAFLPALESPAFDPEGRSHAAESDEATPWQEQRDTVSALVEAAYQCGWVLKDFDWGTWQASAEATRLLGEPEAIAAASPEQLARLLTTVIRKDCFLEGELDACVSSGLVTRIVRRAAALAVGAAPAHKPKARYTRPTRTTPLTKVEKLDLLRSYAGHYSRLASSGAMDALNQKIDRAACDDLFDRIGAMLLDESATLAGRPGPLRDFLQQNALPGEMARLLPDEFRAFCLVLNGLKQWVAKEQAATDRYLFGASARELYREAFETCLVTAEPFGPDAELHHPVRDGRPPILLSKAGHRRVEGQQGADGGSEVDNALLSLRRKTNRSWVHLKQGCLEMLKPKADRTSGTAASAARSFAKRASAESGLGYQELLDWLEARQSSS